MAFLQRFIPTFIFCVLSLSIFSQNAPSPTSGGGGPLQNPRPNSSNTNGGGGVFCPNHHSAAFLGESINIFINVNSDDPFYTLPANIPPLHLSITYTGGGLGFGTTSTLLYVSDAVTSFSLSEYSCVEDPALNFYFAELELPIATLETLLQEILQGQCLENGLDAVYGILTFQLSTYNSSGDLVDFEIELAPDLFSCTGSQTSFNSNSFVFCCDVVGPIISTEDDPIDSQDESEFRSRLDNNNNDLKSPRAIFPNPFKSELRCSDSIKDLRILNSSGEIVFEHKGTCNSINTKSWTPGMYIVQSYDGTSWKSEKFIKTE